MNVLVSEAIAAFSAELSAPPRLTLRAGNSLDGYEEPAPFDPKLDEPNDDYFERFFWGLPYLDPASWRHYLPHLMRYTLAHPEGSNVGEALLESLRPPERTPARLGSLSDLQSHLVVRFLDALAFDESSPYAASAQQALEEWWAPGAIYRTCSK